MLHTQPAAPFPSPAVDIAVRPAMPQDAGAIAQLLASIGWFSAYQQGSPATHSQRLHDLITHAQGRSTLLVAERTPTAATPSDIIGYCALHWLPVAVQLGEEAYVSELFVHDSARGTGAGSALLQAATQAAQARGCVRMWLVNNRERASYQRGFYAQQGWQEQPEMARFVLPLS